jgi:predicted RecA/RadA family phage recombinase
MKNYIQEGERIDFTAGATTASGAGVKIGVRFGIACSDVANGAVGVAAMAGVFNVPKLSTDVVAQGVLLFWDDTNKRLTTTSAGNTQAGYAQNAAGNGATTVDIMINR